MNKLGIDIGHGKNTYPPSKGIGDFAEWDFNNAVGKYAKELAELNGFEVYMSQPVDSDSVNLDTRVRNINAQKVDFGVSIHANANASTEAEGHWGFYWHTSSESKKLAEFMSKNATTFLKTKSRGITPSEPSTWTDFAMCRDTAMPFVLFEFGFFTNPKELALLKSDEFRKASAMVIVKSACDYVGRAMKGYPSPVIETIRIVSPVVAPAPVVVAPIVTTVNWKLTGLKELNEVGLVNDFEGWSKKLDEPAPNWLVFHLVNELRKRG